MFQLIEPDKQFFVALILLFYVRIITSKEAIVLFFDILI